MDLPEAYFQGFDPVDIEASGHWGVLCDPHFPYQDNATIYKFADECNRVGVQGILLNGDVLDAYYLSKHPKVSRGHRFRHEIDVGRQFMGWLRGRFPRIRIIYKEGNHDYRLRSFISEKAPELDDLEEVTIPSLLHLSKYGIDWVQDKRVINLGKLSVVHGHEFRGSGGVNPARWLMQRTLASTMTGHFHRPDEFYSVTIDREQIGTFSVGCACYLHPEYMPINQWSHGYAMVEILRDQRFRVTNRKILRDGTIV